MEEYDGAEGYALRQGIDPIRGHGHGDCTTQT